MPKPVKKRYNEQDTVRRVPLSSAQKRTSTYVNSSVISTEL